MGYQIELINGPKDGLIELLVDDPGQIEYFLGRDVSTVYRFDKQEKDKLFYKFVGYDVINPKHIPQPFRPSFDVLEERS